MRGPCIISLICLVFSGRSPALWDYRPIKQDVSGLSQYSETEQEEEHENIWMHTKEILIYASVLQDVLDISVCY